MMNLNQTKLVGLTMELDLKAREYKTICDKLDDLKEKEIDPNDERLLAIKELFQRNHEDIVEINRQIKEIKETEKIKEKQKLEQYNPETIFNEKSKNIKNEQNKNTAIIKIKKNIFIRIIERIKKFFQTKYN